MAKGDNERTRKDLEQSQNQSNTQYGQLWTEQGQAAPDINASGASERQNLLSGLGNFAQTGGVNPDDAARMRAYANPSQPTTASNSGASNSGDSGVSNSPAGPPAAPLFGDAYSGYQGFANNGGVNYGALTQFMPTFQDIAGQNAGFDPTRLANINSSSAGLRDIGSTGGYDPTALGQIRSDIYNIRTGAANGGYDPAQLAGLRGTVNQLRDYGKSGGLTPDEIAAYHDPGYEEFANTGGFNPGQISTYRNANTAAIQGLGNSQQRQLEQAQRANPSGANYAATLAKASRGNAQGLGDAALTGELNLNNAINSGRQFGIAGRAGQTAALDSLLSQNRINATNSAASQGGALEGNVANNRFNMLQAAATGTGNLEQALTTNRLAGLTGAGNLDLSTQQAMNNSRLSAATGGSTAIGNAEGLVQQGKLAGLGGMTTIDQYRQQAAEQAAAQASADAANQAALAEQGREFDTNADFANRQFGSGIEQYLMSTGQQGQLAGLTGLQNLYGQTYAPAQENFTNRLNVANSQTQANQGYTQGRIATAALPGKGQTIANNAIRAAVAVGTLGGSELGRGIYGAVTGGGNSTPIVRKPTDIRV